jgi:divalent metal cation (Fe/Co/Zn/Cd) transporter
MRSLAVLVASAIATIFPSIEGEIADSSAAIIVSLIIISSLFPLIYGLFLTAREIVILSRTPLE